MDLFIVGETLIDLNNYFVCDPFGGKTSIEKTDISAGTCSPILLFVTEKHLKTTC